MEITSVKITLVPDDTRVKAYASIVWENCFVVHDLKIIHTPEKMFVAMPSKVHKGGGGAKAPASLQEAENQDSSAPPSPVVGKTSFRDIAHPLDQKTRNKIQEAVFKEYEKQIRQFYAEGEKLKFKTTGKTPASKPKS